MKPLIKYVLLGLLPTTLGGCGLYRDFTTPSIEQRNLVSSNTKLPYNTVQKSPTWRSFYADEHLHSLITQALTNNKDLRVAQIAVTQAQQSFKTARLSMLPTLSIGADADAATTNRSDLRVSLPATAQWELDVFGKIRNAKEQSRATLEQSHAYAQMVRTQLIAHLATNYYTLVALDEQLRITLASEDMMQQTVNTLECLKASGKANAAAVSQATANHKDIIISIEDLKKSIALCQNNIALLLNQPPSAISRSPISDIRFHYNNRDAISLVALSCRPDVRYAEAQLRHSFYGVSHARSMLYPSIKLTGSAGWSHQGDASFDPSDMLFSALASLTQPIFMAGANRARLKIAQAEYEKQLLQFEYALLHAGNEVNGLLTTCQTAVYKQKIRQEQIAHLKTAVSSTKLLMQSGQVNYLEILTAQNTLLQAKVSASSEWLDAAIAEIGLYRALGGY